MKKNFTLIFTCLFVFQIHAQTQFKDVPGQLLIMLTSNDEAATLEKAFRTLDGKITRLKAERLVSKRMHTWLYTFDHRAIQQDYFVDKITEHPLVLIGQSDHTGIELRTDSLLPNDPFFYDQWYHYNDGVNYPSGFSGGDYDADLDTPEAWAIETGGLSANGDTIVVAVVDGGGKFPHEDLNWWKNYGEIPNNGIDDDANGYVDDYLGWNGDLMSGNVTTNNHGTHVAGIIGAIGNNGKGVTGVNWDVQLMMVSNGWVRDVADNIFENKVIGCYDYILEMRSLYNESNGAKGAFIVATNSSFGVDKGTPARFPIWCALYDSLGKQGMISMGATTNNAIDVDVQGDIPTNCPSDFFVGVGKTLTSENSGAGYGTVSVDLGAPGSWAKSTSSASSTAYEAMGGTSQATPMVTGVLSLMYAAACPKLLDDYKLYPDSIAKIMRMYLLQAVDTFPSYKNKFVTGGRLNAHKALLALDQYDCIGVGEMEFDQQLKVTNIFPNPTFGILNVSLTTPGISSRTINVVDLVGRVQLSKTIAKGERKITLDLSHLAKACYFITVQDASGKIITERFIKN